MVHHHLGTARITYPRGVKLSPVDPMTSANLPARILAVPGVVPHPIRLSLYQPHALRVAAMGYYPRLGQATTTDLLGTASSAPTWIWYAGAGVLALVLFGFLLPARGRAKSAPRVRTVTRTTF